MSNAKEEVSDRDISSSLDQSGQMGETIFSLVSWHTSTLHCFKTIKTNQVGRRTSWVLSRRHVSKSVSIFVGSASGKSHQLRLGAARPSWLLALVFNAHTFGEFRINALN